MTSLHSLFITVRNKFSRPIPPSSRPSEPGYQRRLWDQLYGEASEENRLKRDVLKQFEQGKSLREALLLVESLVEVDRALDESLSFGQSQVEAKEPRGSLVRKFLVTAIGRRGEILLATEMTVVEAVQKWVVFGVMLLSYLSFLISRLHHVRWCAKKSQSIY